MIVLPDTKTFDSSIRLVQLVGGAIPSLGEIRNCHINVGTGKELTIRELSELVVKAVGFEGVVDLTRLSPTAQCASSLM